jgi:hypothetical protein
LAGSLQTYSLFGNSLSSGRTGKRSHPPCLRVLLPSLLTPTATRFLFTNANTDLRPPRAFHKLSKVERRTPSYREQGESGALSRKRRAVRLATCFLAGARILDLTAGEVRHAVRNGEIRQIIRSKATSLSTRILDPDCRPVPSVNPVAGIVPVTIVVCSSVPRPPSNDDDDASYRRPAQESPTSSALRWPQPRSEAMISFSESFLARKMELPFPS